MRFSREREREREKKGGKERYLMETRKHENIRNKRLAEIKECNSVHWKRRKEENLVHPLPFGIKNRKLV